MLGCFVRHGAFSFFANMGILWRRARTGGKASILALGIRSARVSSKFRLGWMERYDGTQALCVITVAMAEVLIYSLIAVSVVACLHGLHTVKDLFHSSMSKAIRSFVCVHVLTLF